MTGSIGWLAMCVQAAAEAGAAHQGYESVHEIYLTADFCQPCGWFHLER
jgi:hypothetical protein